MKSRSRRKILSRLSHKIIISIIAVGVIVSIVTAFLLYHSFQSVIKKQVMADNQFAFLQIQDEINHLYTDAIRFGGQISSDALIQSYMEEERESALVERLLKRKRIINYLSKMQTLSGNIDSIAFVTADEVVAFTQIPFLDSYSEELINGWYQACLDSFSYEEGKSVKISEQRMVSNPYEYSYYSGTNQTNLQYISISIPVFSIENSGKCYGNLIINVSMERIREILVKGLESFDRVTYSSQDNTAVTDLTVSVGQMSGSYDYLWTDTTSLRGILICSIYEKNSFWIILKAIPGLVSVLLFLLILIVGALIPMLLHMTHPVAILIDAMRRVGKGDLLARAAIHSGDEFQELGEELNKMIQRLDTMMKKALQNEQDRHELEYEVLLSQINPHFIYNTLNTVTYLARKERSADVIIITKALIELLQDGIKLQDNKIYSPVSAELSIIRNYCCIQNYRYPDKFELIVECPEELQERMIPTSVIQPIIENALFHGIAPMDGKGTVLLKIQEECEEQNYLTITIADNGIGMSEEKRRQIMQGKQVSSDMSKNHIGIENISKRLDLLYGEEYTIIYSEGELGGNQVKIRIPV